MSEVSSRVLYVFIWGISIIFGFLAEERQKKLDKIGKKRINGYFIVASTIIGLTYSIADISADYINYIQIYKYLTWNNFLQVTSVEPLYSLLCLIIKLFFKDATVGMCIIKALIVFLYMKAIYILRDKIHLGYAIMTYMSLLYLDAFCMISMHLAVAMCAYSFALFMKDGKLSVQNIIWGIVAVFVHYTCLLYLIVMLFIYVIFTRKKMNVSFWVIFSLVACGVVYLYFDVFLSILIRYVPTFNKYLIYQNISYSGTGIMQFIYHVPFIVILIYVLRYRKDRKMGLSILFFEIVGFAMAMLGYRIEVISRLYVLCTIPIMMGISQLLKRNAIKFKDYQTRMIISLLLMGYFVFRFIDNMSSTLKSLGLEEYHTIFMN